MVFIRQFYLLCWKNYVSKKRNIVRLVIEVFLPIILFLVLMFLRRIGDKKIYPDCYFKPKAMPSAGDLAFYQSFYCSLNNTCEDSTANASLPVYDSSLVSKIMKAMEQAFDLQSPALTTNRDLNAEESEVEFNNVTDKFRKYFEVIKSTFASNEELKGTNIGSLLSSLTIAKAGDTKFKCGRANFRFLSGNLPKFDDTGGWPEDNDLETTTVSDTKDSSPTNFTTASFGMEAIIESPLLKELDNILCGPDVPGFAKQILSLSGQTEKSWERKKEEMESQSLSTSASHLEFQEPEYENDTSEFCNDIMRNIEMSLETRIVWRLFKPFVRGKIIFAPNAPVIERLMGRINDSFSRPHRVISDLINTDGGIGGLRELNILRNNDDILRNLASSELGGDLLRLLGLKSDGNPESKKTSDHDMKALRKLLDELLLVFNRAEAEMPRIAVWQQTLKNYMECIDWSRVVGYNTSEEAETAALSWMTTERLWALVEFVGIPPDAEELPPGITYKIRTGIERTHGTFQIRDRVYRPKVRRDPLIDLKHITGGWAYIQNLVESEIIREQTGRVNVPGIYLQQTPYPCHIKDMFRESITRTLPMFMIVSWIFLFSMLIRRIVWEKEKRVTQTLRVMGVGKTTHWLSWFIDAFVPMLAVSLLLSLILVYGKIIPFSSFIVVWIFLIVFIFPTITLAFLISTLFSKASFAAAVSGFLFLLIYLPYPPISQFEERLDPFWKVTLCLVSNIAFGLGCTWLANMEELAVGGHLYNMHISPVPGNPISMNLILSMLILDAVIYLLLALYIESVFPGDDVAGRPFYFPFTKSFWCGSDDKDVVMDRPEMDAEKFEPDPVNAIAGVTVRGLTKKFGHKVALNNLSINFYEDQITSFLGHNGAGKSTAISIMTGLAAASSGQVLLYGEFLTNNCEVRNRKVGICSQENVLLEDLTVEEHLQFFACMKGLPDEEAEKDAEKMMSDVGILLKRSTLPKHLSGGTQRKLCVAIALIGGSKVIFLDEPTAGVDPLSRRAIWDLLVKYKKGRTVVLTTHFMDEADLLGDRIAIISKGELVCCGSPVFLKTKLGSGYYLTVDYSIRSDNVGRAVRGPEGEMSQLAQQLKSLVQTVLPSAYFLEQIGSEIVFVIPLQNSVDKYGELFTTLSKEQEKGIIKSYGISDTSLEEIFLKMTAESEIQDDSHDDQEVCCCFNWKMPKGYSTVATAETFTNGVVPPRHEPLTLQASFWQRSSLHFVALTIKRALHHVRNYKALIVEIVVPAVFVALAVFLSSLLPSIRYMPPLEIDISAYAPSYIFYSMDVPNSPVLKSYERELLSSTGLGTVCARYPEKCSSESIPRFSMVAPIKEEDTTPCPCAGGRYSCPFPPTTPPWTEMSSGDRLYNLTGQNITNWIVKTELTESYIRYGGISFGYPRAFNSLGLLDLIDVFQIKSLLPMIGMVLTQRSVPSDTAVSADSIISILMGFCSETVGKLKLSQADINDNIIIWYNNRGWISGIGFMNAVSNLVLRASLPAGKDPSKYYIRLINHPMGITARQFQDEIDKQSNVSLLRAMVIIWALAFIPATYAVYLIGERSSGFKHLQIINGVGRTMYWVATFVWDFVCFVLTILILVIIFLCYQDEAFVGRDSIVPFLCLMFAYAAVSITFVYPLSFIFKVPSSGFVAVSTINVFVGMVTLLTTFVLTLVQEEDNPFYLNTIFMIFPQFCLGKALLNMSIISITVKTLSTFGVIEHPHYFEWNTTTKYIVVMLILTVVFALVTLALEFRVFQKSDQVNQKDDFDYVDDDDDVREERRQIMGAGENPRDNVLLLKNLTKWYHRQSRPAVNKLCLDVKGGQCFGLLGLNGAGKTTVFKMLTGSLRPTYGTASILGEEIKSNSRLRLGYCPQSNALDPYLTCEEHLAFFARLHGGQGDAVGDIVERNIARLGIEIHRYKMSKALSGGNKRKLNTALALVGEPRVVLLDEPTSGMDPRARRFLWQCVQKCVLEGKCVVLTSHSMEECQTLCTRLSILVNGQFRCLGSCQHLKNKFDEGYSVTVRVSSLDTLAEVQTYLLDNLPTNGSMEVNYLQVKLVLNPGVDLALVFNTLDTAKAQHLIRDYSISQTTLEQIFLKLTESQSTSSENQLPMEHHLIKWFSSCCRTDAGDNNVEYPQDLEVASDLNQVTVEQYEPEISPSTSRTATAGAVASSAESYSGTSGKPVKVVIMDSARSH